MIFFHGLNGYYSKKKTKNSTNICVSNGSNQLYKLTKASKFHIWTMTFFLNQFLWNDNVFYPPPLSPPPSHSHYISVLFPLFFFVHWSSIWSMIFRHENFQTTEKMKKTETNQHEIIYVWFPSKYIIHYSPTWNEWHFPVCIVRERENWLQSSLWMNYVILHGYNHDIRIFFFSFFFFWLIRSTML